MFTPKRPIGLISAEDIARVRRVTKDVMDSVGLERPWTDPFEKVAVYSAVDVCVTTLVRQGETNEGILRAAALATVEVRTERRRS